MDSIFTCPRVWNLKWSMRLKPRGGSADWQSGLHYRYVDDNGSPYLGASLVDKQLIATGIRSEDRNFWRYKLVYTNDAGYQ